MRLCRCRRCRQQISIIVPFQSKEPSRRKNWRWLKRYWKAHLPEAEVIIGKDRKSQRRLWRRHPRPYSKTTAVNKAFRKAHGDIIVILDADCYIWWEVLNRCATQLREARKRGERIWFVPYRKLIRLNKAKTDELLGTNPRGPFQFTTSLSRDEIEWSEYNGHQFGAMIQIMPREAFELLGGMDERFNGWGGEDVAFLNALDTLWGKHRNTPNPVFHLWHSKLSVGTGGNYPNRAWERQERPIVNEALNRQYARAKGRPRLMQQLMREAHQ